MIDLFLTQDNTLTDTKRKLAERNSDKVTESSQVKDCKETKLQVGKRRFEKKSAAEEEPPTKKGTISTISQQGVFKKSLITIPEQKQKAVRCKSYVMRRKSMLNCKRK